MDRSRESSAQKVFANVLAKVKPNKQEVKDMILHVNTLSETLAKIVPRDVELHVAGSIARGTNLRGAADVDIFMLFKKTKSKESIEKQGLEYGKELAKKLKGRWEIKYAEHPYIRVYLGLLKAKADIVPAFKIDNAEDLGTAVDRTPLHTKFINDGFTDRQRDETRLLKAFLKAHHIYGAEVKINGFSGYLCELMIYNYGSILKLLEAISAMKLPLVMNPKNNTEQIDANALIKRFNSEFIVIDPVDRNRNVAAGVSLESLGRFAIAARAFVEKPSMESFEGHVNQLRKYSSYDAFIKQSRLDSFVIEANVSDKSDDVVFPQLRKISHVITEYAERSGFSIYITVPFVAEKKGYIAILAQRTELKTRLIKGPDVFIPQASNNFIKAHRQSDGFVIKGRTIFALDYNKYESIEKLLQEVAKGKLVNGSDDVKIKGSRIYMNKVPKNVEKMLIHELEKKLLL